MDPPGPCRLMPSPSVRLQVLVSSVSPSGFAWSLYKCGALCMVVYGSSATGRPHGTIRKEKGISAIFQVSISSRYDLTCWKSRKNPSPFSGRHVSFRCITTLYLLIKYLTFLSSIFYILIIFRLMQFTHYGCITLANGC